MRDWRGLTVSNAAPATLAAMDDFATGFLGYHPRMLGIAAAADADPGCALAQAQVAILHMLAETRSAPDAARPHLDRAERVVAGTTGRERKTVAAVRAWAEDDIDRSLGLLDEIATEHPRDIVAAKLAQMHRFNRGDAAGMRHSGLVAQAANDDVAHAHSMAAFGHEQCNDMRAAERAAMAALAIDPDEPWGHHAMAHIMLTEGRNAEARAFLTEAAPSWDGRFSFIRTHNHWHLALVRIEQGDGAAVLDAFDRHVWNDEPSLPQDQVGAVSLLARLELVGVDVGGRWAGLAPWLRGRIDDHVQPFLSMQYLYGLSRAGDQAAADEMMAAIRATAAQSAWRAWGEVCVPACEGLLAHARGDFAWAAGTLGAVSAEDGADRRQHRATRSVRADFHRQPDPDGTDDRGRVPAPRPAGRQSRQSADADRPVAPRLSIPRNQKRDEACARPVPVSRGFSRTVSRPAAPKR